MRWGSTRPYHPRAARPVPNTARVRRDRGRSATHVGHVTRDRPRRSPRSASPTSYFPCIPAIIFIATTSDLDLRLECIWNGFSFCVSGGPTVGSVTCVLQAARVPPSDAGRARGHATCPARGATCVRGGCPRPPPPPAAAPRGPSRPSASACGYSCRVG